MEGAEERPRTAAGSEDATTTAGHTASECAPGYTATGRPGTDGTAAGHPRYRSEPGTGRGCESGPAGRAGQTRYCGTAYLGGGTDRGVTDPRSHPASGSEPAGRTGSCAQTCDVDRSDARHGWAYRSAGAGRSVTVRRAIGGGCCARRNDRHGARAGGRRSTERGRIRLDRGFGQRRPGHGVGRAVTSSGWNTPVGWVGPGSRSGPPERPRMARQPQGRGRPITPMAPISASQTMRPWRDRWSRLRRPGRRAMPWPQASPPAVRTGMMRCAWRAGSRRRSTRPVVAPTTISGSSGSPR